MSVKFSVVIPTHNRINQLLLTLASLESQTISPDKYEVIVVNDSSDDGTVDRLSNYQPNYLFKIVNNQDRGGPGVARNLGAKHAKGKYLIFCDADFIVMPNFFEVFNTYHSRFKNAIISATPHCYQGVYTLYYPDFNEFEKKQFYSVVRNSGLWREEFYTADQIMEVISPMDIKGNSQKLFKVRLPYNPVSQELKAELQSTDVAPWLLFITRCVSIEKKWFEIAGGFDERLIRGAGEDWELGYRLYKLGRPFVSINEVIGYHQEHPHGFRQPFKEFEPFNKILLQKFGETPELLLLSLWDSSDDFWNDITKYKKVLRLLNTEVTKNIPEFKDVESLLLKACKLSTKRWEGC
jgi:glycosyltransferase involved in cell wall biosynthesis